jgi:hypothetical protein
MKRTLIKQEFYNETSIIFTEDDDYTFKCVMVILDLALVRDPGNWPVFPMPLLETENTVCCMSERL